MSASASSTAVRMPGPISALAIVAAGITRVAASASARVAPVGAGEDQGRHMEGRQVVDVVGSCGLARWTRLRLCLPQPGDDRLAALTAALAEHPADPRTLAEFGAAVGASERTLSRLFRRQTGMTFPQWRAQLRLHHGLTLLARGMPVTAVASACGYSNPSAFTAAFRDTFGVTPARYARETQPS
ncbi:AraC family transcriptional regulator [Frankia sp. Ag45/Mut15]|uniref:AraC family transcriptional regulator n=1 Tax=Frankia umida TaxID=573489 RepID=A0ABT0K4H3_9ACTN|nr:AraC family transcriptional regulator [Frankia umida]MCK9878696.1 AraC family transcriptional regulator [Frankia umida]